MEAVFPRCPVCGQSSGYVVSGVFRNFVQCRYCRAKWRLSSSSSRQLTGLLLHELPKNGQGLWRVQGLGAPLFTLMGREYSVDFWSKLALASGVDWDYLGHCVPVDVASAAIMSRGEKTLYCWSGFWRLRSLRWRMGRLFIVLWIVVGVFC